MARSSFLAFLCFIAIANVCLAQIEQIPWESHRHQAGGQHRYQSRMLCRLENLRVQEPIDRAEAEAGFSEVFNQNDDQFQCAGVAMVRHTIRPRGLLLPGYTNAPKLIYVVEGSGVRGVQISGCPETYQTELRRSRGGSQAGSLFRDQHQKIRQFWRGHLLVVPAGVSHWIYNRGQSDLVLIEFVDTRNVANQIDPFLRKFFLAGRPQQLERGVWEEEGESRRIAPNQRRQGGNVFRGFADELLQEAFQIDGELVRRLKGEDDERDRIVQATEDFEALLPQADEQERERERYRPSESENDNGLEETICTLRLKHDIDRSERADVFNPRAGRVSTANYHNLPVLRQVRLSAERGVLYRNALLAPQYSVNSHTVIYATRGSAWVQIVDNFGQSVFDGELRERQALTVPQNFAVMKRAGEQGFEWIAFKTNDNAVTNLMAGRLSQIRALPLGVLTNSYRISMDEAQQLKHNRQELRVLSPGRSPASPGRRE